MLRAPAGALGAVVLFSALALAQPAPSRPFVWAVSDLETVEPSDEIPCPKRGRPSAAAPAGAPSASGTTAPGAVPDEALKELEDALEELEPGDPGHAQLKATLEQLKKAARPPAAPAARPAAPASAGSTKPVGLAQALGTLQAALEGSVTAKALAGLEASPAWRDARRAERLAAAGRAAGKPLASVALTLRAHRLEPRSPAHLVNLSGLANHYGPWQESLAFLNAADALKTEAKAPWGIPGQAIALNNRGQALIGVGKSKEAEAALRRALSLAPILAEARTNLALALGEQNKCKEAVRSLRAGRWRTPPRVEATPGDPTKELERRPIEALFDLSRGQDGTLPPLKYLVEPERAAAPAAWHEAEERAVEARVKTFGARYTAEARRAADRLLAWNRSADPSARLTGRRADRIFGPIHGGLPGQDGAQRFEAVNAAAVKYAQAEFEIERSYDASRRASEETRSRATAACSGPDAGACQERARAEHDARMCTATRAWNNAWRTPIGAYEKVVRDYHRRHDRVMTGLIANLSEPALVTAAGTRVEMTRGANYLLVLGPVSRHLNNLAGRGQACLQPKPESFGGTGLAAAGPQACRAPALKPKAKLAILEVSYTCEQVELELSTPGWLGAFVNVGYEFSKRHERLEDPKARFVEKQAGRDPDRKLVLRRYGHAFGGKLTVVAGGKVGVGAGGSDVSGKGGAYVSVDGGGNVMDVGIKGDTSSSAGVELGPVGFGLEAAGPGGQISFLSSE